MLALNSYGNRVYPDRHPTIGPVDAKFYRPGRWSDGRFWKNMFRRRTRQQDSRQHPPLNVDGATLHHFNGFPVFVEPRAAAAVRRNLTGPECIGDDRALSRTHSRAGQCVVIRASPASDARTICAETAQDGYWTAVSSRRHPPAWESITALAIDGEGRVRARRRCARFGCTAIATPVTCSTPTKAALYRFRRFTTAQRFQDLWMMLLEGTRAG